jgi:hypothetical protein
MNPIERSETSIYSAQKICLVREVRPELHAIVFIERKSRVGKRHKQFGLIRHWMMGCQRSRELRMFPNGVIIVARWRATVGMVALAKMESTIHSAVLDAAASIFRKGLSHYR